MTHKCIVCKEETGKFDKNFRAGFCESEDCIQQITYGWGSLEDARLFYRLLYTREDGSEADTPLNWVGAPAPAPTMFTHVRAAKYDK